MDLPDLLAGSFPHRHGNGEHAYVYVPEGQTPALVIDLRGNAWDEDPEEFSDDFGDEAWPSAFTAVALPDTVPGRVWVCQHADEGVPGVAWQSTAGSSTGDADGLLTVVLFPDIAAPEAFDEWLWVDEGWVACLFPALFAPEEFDTPPAAERTVEEMTHALTCLDEAAAWIASFALDEDAPLTLGTVLSMLGWAGAGKPGERIPSSALEERHGAAAGRYAFEWRRRGYSEADRRHFIEWLDTEAELLLWNTNGGAQMESLTRWLDGDEPLLHGVDASWLVWTVLASCEREGEEPWSAADIRVIHDRGLRDPSWWVVIADAYLREQAAGLTVAETVMGYALAWAEQMPLNVAVWYIAHEVRLGDAATSYASGQFSRDAFVTMWALSASTATAEHHRTLVQSDEWDADWPVPVTRAA